MFCLKIKTTLIFIVLLNLYAYNTVIQFFSCQNKKIILATYTINDELYKQRSKTLIIYLLIHVRTCNYNILTVAKHRLLLKLYL